jgi:hypothetical protein
MWLSVAQYLAKPLANRQDISLHTSPMYERYPIRLFKRPRLAIVAVLAQTLTRIHMGEMHDQVVPPGKRVFAAHPGI